VLGDSQNTSTLKIAFKIGLSVQGGSINESILCLQLGLIP
jgi:hypothetical protein